MTESPPSGVLADELRAWLEFTTKTGVRLPYRPFRLVVEDVLAALASPPPTQATGAPQWLPIESAPIDKPLILGATGWVEQGWWDDDRGEWYAVNTHWTDAHGGCLYPTHWQPLPATLGETK